MQKKKKNAEMYLTLNPAEMKKIQKYDTWCFYIKNPKTKFTLRDNTYFFIWFNSL